MDHVPFKKFATNAVHVGNEPEKSASNDLVSPLSLSVTFRQSEPGVFKVHDYARSGNPTRNSLEKALAATENAAHTVAFGSGTGALSAIVHLLSQGDEIISMDTLYGGTYTYFDNIANTDGIKITYVNMSDYKELKDSFTSSTRMVYLESPTNPKMSVLDIEAVVRIVKGHDKDIIIVMDNSFTTPYFLRPLDLGVDISYQSVSKYIGGHADVMMGSASVNNETIAKRLKYLQHNMGAIPAPFDCYLILRSLKTLPVRMKEHMKNGLLVAQFLEKHPCIEQVNHPGLPSHPQYALFKRQSRGYSGIFSFYLKGGKDELFIFFRHLKVFTVAVSFGGCESVVSFPVIMSHKGLSPQVLQTAGVTDNMARVSVGLEDTDDLIADLDQALWSTDATSRQKSKKSPGTAIIKVVSSKDTQTEMERNTSPIRFNGYDRDDSPPRRNGHDYEREERTYYRSEVPRVTSGRGRERDDSSERYRALERDLSPRRRNGGTRDESVQRGNELYRSTSPYQNGYHENEETVAVEDRRTSKGHFTAPLRPSGLAQVKTRWNGI